MIDHEETLRRLRAADPVPRLDDLDDSEVAALLSVTEERRAAMAAASTRSPSSPPRGSRLRPVLVFGVAFVAVAVAIGAVVLLLRGDNDTAGIPTATTAAPATTSTEAAPTTAASSPAAEVSTTGPASATTLPPLAYNEILDGSATAFATTMDLDPNGNPVILSQMVADGTEADPVVGVLRLLHCSDPACAGDIATRDLTDAVSRQSPESLQLRVAPNGNPVVAYDLGGGSQYGLIVCADPDCASFEAGPVTNPDDSFVDQVMNLRNWSFGSDGLPLRTRISYETDPLTLSLAACGDPGCASEAAVTEIEAIPAPAFFIWFAEPFVLPDGGVLLSYAVMDPIGPPDPEAGYDGATTRGTLKAAYCSTPACPGGPVVTTIAEGTMAGYMSVLGLGPDGLPFILHTIGEIYHEHPPDASMVLQDFVWARTACLDPACTTFDTTEIGTSYELGPYFGWDAVLDAAGKPYTVISEELEYEELPIPDRILLGHLAGDSWVLTHVATPTLHPGFVFGGGLAMVIGPDDLPLIAYGDDQGVHLVRCPDAACTPPAGEEPPQP